MELVPTWKGESMLNKEECQKACLYLLKHCYETDAPALENGEEGKTYTFTPSGFKESEIFKQLIEEHFYPQPLKFENLKKDMWIWDDKYKECRKIYKIYNKFYDQIRLFRCVKNDEGAFFEDGRFYPINIQRIEGEGKC